MSQCRVSTVSLALLALSACQSDPACPQGTTKVKNVCVADDPATGGSGDAGALPADGGAFDAAADGAVAVSDAGDGAGCADGQCPDGCVPATETCNGLDDDCDGKVDEEVTQVLYVDADRDGHGAASDPGEIVCNGHAVEGKVTSHDDCDDDCDHCFPQSNETLCDGRDDECDGMIDDGVLLNFVLDCDGDGFAPGARTTLVACAPAELPAGCAEGAWRLEPDLQSGADCDDRERRANPAAAEVCDHLDNDCNGKQDDKDGVADALLQKYTLDCDGDEYAPASPTTVKQCPNDVRPPAPQCSASRLAWRLPSELRAGTDCDDLRDNRNPGETDVCDHLDNDCDNLEDELGATNRGQQKLYRLDCDGDGYTPSNGRTAMLCPGEMRPATTTCAMSGAGIEYEPSWILSGSERGTDCADADADAHPGVTASYATPVGGAGGSYDYNCDGQQTLVFATRSCGASDTCNDGGSGHSACFDGQRTCGSRGNVETCECEGGDCNLISTPKTIPCR